MKRLVRDLFSLDRQFERLPLPDAEVLLMHNPMLPLPADELFARLNAETPWRAKAITMWGKEMMQPRLIAWYGDREVDYTYSGLTLKGLEWTPLLLALKDDLEAACGVRFNSVLMNLYRNERDSMGMHADDERELGGEPVIASLSLGTTRMFTLKHRTRNELPNWRIPLESGTLLVMRGATQQHWKHAVPKQTKPCGPRINLTFRTILR